MAEAPPTAGVGAKYTPRQTWGEICVIVPAADRRRCWDGEHGQRCPCDEHGLEARATENMAPAQIRGVIEEGVGRSPNIEYRILNGEVEVSTSLRSSK
jgi:hypothetical protein